MRTYQPLSNDSERPVRRCGIELPLAERIWLEAICRVMKIEAHQRYTYMDQLYDEGPQNLACSIKKYG